MSVDTRTEQLRAAAWAGVAGVAIGTLMLPWMNVDVGSDTVELTFADITFDAEPGLYGLIGTFSMWLMGALTLLSIGAIHAAGDDETIDDDTRLIYRAPAWGLLAAAIYFSWRVGAGVQRIGNDDVTGGTGILLTVGSTGLLCWVAHATTRAPPSPPPAQPVTNTAPTSKPNKGRRATPPAPARPPLEPPTSARNSAEVVEHLYFNNSVIVTRAWQLQRGDRIMHRSTAHRIVAVRTNKDVDVTVHLDDATSVTFGYNTFVDVISE